MGHDEPSSIPPPQRVRHLPTLWWWLALIGAVLLAHQLPRGPARTAAPPAPAPARAPSLAAAEPFLVLMFGKVGRGTDALPPQALREQLARLKAEGVHAVRLEDVQALLQRGRPLPPKAVLLAFDEAGRETIDAVEPLLAALDWPALAFVSVEGVAAGNIALVSRRRLEQMTQSGHWTLGLGACREPAGDFDAAALRRQATELQAWGGQPVRAIACSRWSGAPDAPARWTAALTQASLPLGFIPHTSGVNGRGDAPTALHVARIGSGERDPDALVRRAAALAPHDALFVDEFEGPQLDPHWIVNGGRARVDHGALRLAAAAGDAGTLTFAGSARWQDARVRVELDAAPGGQFWIYVRNNGPRAFVRLGTVGRQVVLQRSDASGRTRQLGAVDAPRSPLRLSLSVIGARAIATVDGQPLTDRPVDLPPDLSSGPASLMVYGGADRTSAQVNRVEIEPLPRHIALLPAHPGGAAFEQLRRMAAELWAVSPRRFRWRHGAGSDDVADAAVEMLAGLHRVAMLPAVTVTQLPGGEEWFELRKQMLAWADQPQFAGLNLALEQVEVEDMGRIRELRSALAGIGKQLVVTSPDDTGDLETPRDIPWFTGPRATGFVVVTASLQRVSG